MKEKKVIVHRRIAEDAKNNLYLLPLTPLVAGQGRRQWKSTKQYTLRKRQKASILWLRYANTGILFPEGLSHFAFRRLSEKQK